MTNINIGKNKIIELVRGDTCDLRIYLNVGNDLYPLPYLANNTTSFYFGICEPHQKFEDAILRQKYTKEDIDSEGFLKVHIKAEETENLAPGKYYYCLKAASIKDEEEIVDTLVNKTLFYII